MRTGHVLFSAVHFFVVLFLIAFGGCLLALPFAESVKMQLIHLIYYKANLLMWIGAAIVSFSSILFVFLYLLNRRCFLKLQTEKVSCLIDEKVALDYVIHYWKEHFPDEETPDVVVHHGKTLEVIARAPKTWEENAQKHLAMLEHQLGDELSFHLGYQQTFHLTLSF